jgi:exonuclease VII small subunit
MSNSIFSFEDFVSKKPTNEADLFGVTTSGSDNLPPGYREEDSRDMEDNRNFSKGDEKLELLITDHNEFAFFKDKESGDHYVYYFDPSDETFIDEYCIIDENGECVVDDDSVIVSANDIPPTEWGSGLSDWEEGEKSVIKLDDNLIDHLENLLEEYHKKLINSANREYAPVIKEMIDLLDDIEDEMEDKAGMEKNESEVIEEGEGIHPAVREILISFVEENPDATFAEAKSHVSEKRPGWELSEEDFEEAKEHAAPKVNEGKDHSVVFDAIVRNIRDGYGWIEPDFAAELISDGLGVDIDDELVDAMLVKLADMDLLYYASEENPEEKGEKVTYSQYSQEPQRAPKDEERFSAAGDGVMDMMGESMENMDALIDESVEELQNAQQLMVEAVDILKGVRRKLSSGPTSGSAERLYRYILGHLEPLINSESEWMTRSTSIQDIIDELEDYREFEPEDED